MHLFSFNTLDSLQRCEGWCKGSFHWPLPTCWRQLGIGSGAEKQSSDAGKDTIPPGLHQPVLPNSVVIHVFWRYHWMPCALFAEPVVQGQGQALLVAMQVVPVWSGTENIHFRAVIYFRRKISWLVDFNRYSFYSLPFWKQGRIIWKWTSLKKKKCFIQTPLLQQPK